MNKLTFQYYKPTSIVLTIIVLTIFIYLINNYLSTSFGYTVATSSIIIIIIGFIDKKLWNKPICKLLYNTEDFSGNYKGILKYQFRDANNILKEGELEHIKTIRQNSSNITINSQTFKTNGDLSSPSETNYAFIVEQKNGTFAIYHNYENKGGENDLNLNPHSGTEVLEIEIDEENNKQYLVGKYYTDRKPYQTRGRLKLELIKT